ncbi:HD domain-containing protein [Eubacteriales bacterium OttesenSCG-928-A19]|nr:HD domain-containing protein [Eubacteriales bacterium OttesenSCG-928-A19]
MNKQENKQPAGQQPMLSGPVSDMVKDTRYDAFLLVRTGEQRVGSNGSRYVDMTLCDRTGDINAKLWDSAYSPPPAGSIVRVRGIVQEYHGRLQLRVERIRFATDADPVTLDSLVPCAPEPPEEMMAKVRAAVDTISREDLRTVVTRLLDDAGDTLLTFPAAAKLHHAERGGLLHHVTSMLRMANHYADEYPELDRDLLIAGVVAHDLAKLVELNATPLGTVTDYTPDGQLIGHIVRGVTRIDAIGREVGCDPEILLMLEHMVLAHHGVPEYGSPRPPMFPEAEVLSNLDLLDARIFEMNAAIARVRPGGFSERLWSLDRRLYRRMNVPGQTPSDDHDPDPDASAES